LPAHDFKTAKRSEGVKGVSPAVRQDAKRSEAPLTPQRSEATIYLWAGKEKNVKKPSLRKRREGVA